MCKTCKIKHMVKKTSIRTWLPWAGADLIIYMKYICNHASSINYSDKIVRENPFSSVESSDVPSFFKLGYIRNNVPLFKGELISFFCCVVVLNLDFHSKTDERKCLPSGNETCQQNRGCKRKTKTVICQFTLPITVVISFQNFICMCKTKIMMISTSEDVAQHDLAIQAGSAHKYTQFYSSSTLIS